MEGAIKKINIASSQDGVTKTKLFSLLKQQQHTKKKKTKMKTLDEIYQKMVLKNLDIRRNKAKTIYPERCETKEVSPVTVPACYPWRMSRM